MLSFNFEREIAQPIDAVFAFLRDIDQHPRQPDSIVPVYAKLTPGPPRVGTRYREVIQPAAWLRWEVFSELSRLDPPHRLGYTFAGMGMTGDLLYRLTPTAVGTLIQQHQTLQPHGLLRLLSPLIRLLFGWMVSRRLGQIKTILETGPLGV